MSNICTYCPENETFEYKDVKEKLSLGEEGYGMHFLAVLIDYKNGDVTLEEAANRIFLNVGHHICQEEKYQKFYTDQYHAFQKVNTSSSS